jgi:hypothetical protein
MRKKVEEEEGRDEISSSEIRVKNRELRCKRNLYGIIICTSKLRVSGYRFVLCGHCRGSALGVRGEYSHYYSIQV